jgi:hypothetical protein
MTLRTAALLLAPSLLFAIAPARAESVTEVVKVTVTGGPHAGTYEANPTDGGCSYGLAGKGSWGNQYSDMVDDPKKLSSVQLIVPDAKKAAAGTANFTLTVMFGSLMKPSAEYTVDTAHKKGSGKVTVQDNGKTGKVTFAAVTPNGIKLDGTIDCKAVVRGD